MQGLGGVSWIIAILLMAACATRPPPPPAPPRRTNLALKISKFELSNGLRVVLVRDPRATEVQVTMRYQVGSVDDPPELPGMAHLVEHLMFEQVLGGQTLRAHLDEVATFKHATTTFDATTFVERAQPSHLEKLLSIEAVRVGFGCTSLSDSAFARERDVVLNEIRQNDYAAAVWAAINNGVYPTGHPYRRPVVGNLTSVGAITRDQACGFADAHYGPRNAVLVVSGNITDEQLTTALGKFLARIAKRAVRPPVAVPPVEPTSRHVEALAPFDDEVLLVAWPLPQDPLLRAKVMAIVPAVSAMVDATVKGRVALIQIGDGRAPMLGVVVGPGSGESMQDVKDSVKRSLADVPKTFGQLETAVLGQVAFDRIQQSGIYQLFAKLEDGGDRDRQLAGYLLAGRDPSAVLAAEFAGLREMTHSEGARIVREHLNYDRATVVVFKPTDAKKRGHGLELGPPVHDVGVRRDPPDLAEAHRPVASELAPSGPLGARTRELPNGLKVVLLPLSSVPTIDMRLVFDSGTADEPADRRGAALVAAYGLSWDLRFLNDYLLFAAAGGTNLVDVGRDHTSFTAHGVDMHLDVLLAGLRRWIRDGRYAGGAASVVDALRREAKRTDDEGALTDRWRTALFGAGHPYVQAGLERHADDTLTVDDAARFRTAHYTPDNATLVIAGGFDAALADRWIDYLFADWTGRAAARSSPRRASQPASIAQVDATSQMYLSIALPVGAGDRAHQLVAAEMLSEIASDVRHQLGASYGMYGELFEERLATTYQIWGSIDNVRSREAVELLRARIEQLRTDSDVVARAFVVARNRVLVRLVSVTGSAETLATRVAFDVALERAPMFDRQTAEAVHDLTIAKMAATLAELDLSRAVVMMRGPAAEVAGAFTVLGRKPTYVAVSTVKDDTDEPATTNPPRQRGEPMMMSEYVDPVTQQALPYRLTLAFATGYSTGTVIRHGVSGFALASEVGYRFDQTTTLGLHLSIGQFTGIYDTGRFLPELHPIEVMPIDLAGFVQTTAYDRLWGALHFGFRLDRVTDDSAATWHAGLGIGLQGGLDLLKLQRHRFGVYGRVASAFLADASYSGFTLGLAYRR